MSTHSLMRWTDFIANKTLKINKKSNDLNTTTPIQPKLVHLNVKMNSIKTNAVSIPKNKLKTKTSCWTKTTLVSNVNGKLEAAKVNQNQKWLLLTAKLKTKPNRSTIPLANHCTTYMAFRWPRCSYSITTFKRHTCSRSPRDIWLPFNFGGNNKNMTKNCRCGKMIKGCCWYLLELREWKEIMIMVKINRRCLIKKDRSLMGNNERRIEKEGFIRNQ
jgi:hypothetical protein